MNGKEAQVTVNTPAANRRTRRGPSKAPKYTLKGPINMMAALYALSNHAPWSKLMPTCPRRSASPSESMRLVSVTRPAPIRTPTIPSRGRVDIWEGIAAAVARAICVGVGRVTSLILATVYLLIAWYGQLRSRKDPAATLRLVLDHREQ